MASKRRRRSKYDKKKYGMLHFAIEFVAGVALFLLVVSLILGVARVDGESMYPTLRNSQPVAYLRVGSSYERGDIIAIKMPSGDSYVKRIIGVEGDTVELVDGAVVLNGSELKEDYAQGETLPENARVEYPVTVQAGEVFVLGDNRAVSVDSRDFGCVIFNNIKGKLLNNK